MRLPCVFGCIKVLWIMYNLLFSPQVYPGGIFTCNVPGLRAGGYLYDFHKTLIYP